MTQLDVSVENIVAKSDVLIRQFDVYARSLVDKIVAKDSVPRKRTCKRKTKK